MHLFSTWGFSTLPWMWAGVPPDALQVEVSGRGAHVLRGEKECCEKESEPLGLYKHRFKSELFPWPGMWPWAADSSSLPPFPHL